MVAASDLIGTLFAGEYDLYSDLKRSSHGHASVNAWGIIDTEMPWSKALN